MNFILLAIIYIISVIISNGIRLYGDYKSVNAAFWSLARDKNLDDIYKDELDKLYDEIEGKFKKFFKNYFGLNKIAIFSLIPFFNVLLSLLYVVYSYSDLKYDRIIDNYGAEICAVLDNTLEKTDEVIDRMNNPEIIMIHPDQEFFIRYGEDGHYSTIFFSIDKNCIIHTIDIIGDANKHDDRSLALLVFKILQDIHNGNDQDYGYSPELKKVLQAMNVIDYFDDLEEDSTLDDEQKRTRKKQLH